MTPRGVRGPMVRRRPTLRAFLRRRWRTVGFLAVLLVGALLILAITDRGHDPLWQARSEYVDQLDVSPDGTRVYALIRTDENSPFIRLEARDGAGGEVLWKSDLNESRVLLAADDEGVAVATDFPRAFLTYFGDDGRPRWQVALEGNPRALAVENGRAVVALNSGGGGDKAIVLEDGRTLRTHRFEGFVGALDMEAGHLAVGTSAGRVLLFDSLGEAIQEARVELDVLSLRMASDARAIMVGGYARAGVTEFSGGVAFVDFADEPHVEWTQPTRWGVGIVDLDRAGTRAIAVEESPGGNTLHAYETRVAVEHWATKLTGLVGRNDAGRGSAAIAPDGEVVVVGTIRGGLRAIDADNGERLWAYASDGTTTLAFSHSQPPTFAANARVVPSGPPEAVLLFSVKSEPLGATVAALALVVAGAVVLLGVAVLGVGYWRLRRSAY